jgi:hypothetical protein
MLVKNFDKEMANGMRNQEKIPLSEEEIAFVKREIEIINADMNIFIFNDKEHIQQSTCYNSDEDKIYVTKNIFPNIKYGSTHPRDLLSVRAVLAHEYYGHRPNREEYLQDSITGKITTPYWKDECRASINAAKITPNLTEDDKKNLILDAVYRAKEAGMVIEYDEFMKKTMYPQYYEMGGNNNGERNITPNLEPIKFVSKKSVE